MSRLVLHLIIVLIIVCNEKKADDCEIVLEFYSERQLTFLNYFRILMILSAKRIGKRGILKFY